MFKIISTLLIMSCFFSTLHAQDFVKVEDGDFFIGDKPYTFLGANYWYGPYLGVTEQGQERLKEELDQLESLGVKNLRIMAAFEGQDGDLWRATPGIQQQAGVYDERILKGLDWLLVEMDKRGMKAVLVLNNFWLWSGGMAQYVQWTDSTPIPTPTPYDGSAYPAYTKYTAQFFTNKKAIDLYNLYVSMLVKRVNSITDTPYVSDPTIMSWQLANEPRGMNQVEAYRAWIQQTAQMIRALDSNHLISIGSEGNTTTPLPNGLNFYVDHDVPEIDYCTFHLWIQNWGLFDPMEADKTFKHALKFAKKYIKKHIKDAQKLGKPLVLEEFGVSRDLNDHHWEATTTYRDQYYDFIFKQCQKSIKTGSGLVGCNFWAYGGLGRPREAQGVWKPGDDFVGDPPHEFQGWYSIYDSDISTLEIIQTNAQLINQ